MVERGLHDEDTDGTQVPAEDLAHAAGALPESALRPKYARGLASLFTGRRSDFGVLPDGIKQRVPDNRGTARGLLKLAHKRREVPNQGHVLTVSGLEPRVAELEPDRGGDIRVGVGTLRGPPQRLHRDPEHGREARSVGVGHGTLAGRPLTEEFLVNAEKLRARGG